MSLARFKTQLVTTEIHDSVEAAARTMRDRGVGCVVVLEDGHPIGLLTDRDLVVRVLAAGEDPTRLRVADVVTYAPITVSVDDGIETAVERMRVHGVRRLPLVNERGEAVGIVTADDLLVLLGAEISAVCEGIENRSDATESR
jgi:CBS domain-containing protein